MGFLLLLGVSLPHGRRRGDGISVRERCVELARAQVVGAPVGEPGGLYEPDAGRERAARQRAECDAGRAGLREPGGRAGRETSRGIVSYPVVKWM